MGDVHFGVPERLALFLRDNLGLRTFVETGTFKGQTAAWASKSFERVYSIEASESLWNAAREAHKELENVEFVLGNSPQQLAQLIPHLDRPLFWLDAHWCSGETAGSEAECPLLSELEVIAGGSFPSSAILVDDARYFLKPAPPLHRCDQWPDISTVISAINRCGDFYIVVQDDVIIAVPGSSRADFVRFLNAPHPAEPRRKRRLRKVLNLFGL